MGSVHIQVDTTIPFNKWIMFVFNMQTHLTHLPYKVISFCYYFFYNLIYGCIYMFITIFMVVIVF